jgi:AcrR family transcriptional regulator
MSESSQGDKLSRRERLKREREAQILDAAAAVFAAKGFHQATIREIAERADVADGTIYNYFDNKTDLLIGIMARLAGLERLPGELMQGLEGNPREFFALTIRHRMDRIQEGERMLQAVLPEVMVNPELRQRFYQQYVLRIAGLIEQYLAAQIELGRLRPVDVPLAVRIVQAMFVGLLMLRILGDEPLQAGWDRVPETAMTLIFDGLSLPGEAR